MKVPLTQPNVIIISKNLSSLSWFTFKAIRSLCTKVLGSTQGNDFYILAVENVLVTITNDYITNEEDETKNEISKYLYKKSVYFRLPGVLAVASINPSTDSHST